MKAALMCCALMAAPLLAGAHDGHGQAGSHWHATDAWGFAALAVAVAVLWSQRRK